MLGEAEEGAGRLCLRAASQPPTAAKLPAQRNGVGLVTPARSRHETGLKIINGGK